MLQLLIWYDPLFSLWNIPGNGGKQITQILCFSGEIAPSEILITQY